MKVLLVLLGACCLLFLETQSQGFFPPPNIIDPSPPHNLFQRQLTPSQQNHILSDIQQHQHRFTINQPNHRQRQQFTFQQQPSVEVPIGQQRQQQQNQQQQNQQQFSNQRFPPPPIGNPIRFPNNQLPSNNQQLQQPVIQHHTQTTFIPNFNQQVQQQQQPPQHHHRQSNQFQRSPDNQFNVPQQPFQQPNSVQSQQPQHIPNLDFHRQNFHTLQNAPQNQLLPPVPPTPFNPAPQQQFPPVNFQPIPPSFQHIPVVNGRVVETPKPITTIYYQNPPNNIQQFTGQRIENGFNTVPQVPGATGFSSAPQIPGSTLVQPTSKDQIIQKHEAFLQKQYEKNQIKVKQLHQEFQQKQQSIKQTAPTPSPQQVYNQNYFLQQSQRSRNVLPGELPLFENALKNHGITSPRPTTSTTTQAVRTTATQDPFDKLLQAQRKDIYAQLKLEQTKTTTTQPPQVDQNELLAQLQKALAGSPQPSLGDKKIDSTDIVLPNGQKVQVIRTSDPSLVSGAQPLSPQLAAALQSKSQELVLPTGGKVQILPAGGNSLEGISGLEGLTGLGGGQSIASEARVVDNGDGPPSLAELAAKGLIPEGYEIVQQPAPGSKKAAPKPAPAPKKKPTFVYLEEQADGSFKIQGIKANGEKDPKTNGSELENIVERIQKGDIQLPPSVTRVKLPDGNELILKGEPSTPAPTAAETTTPSTTTTTTTRRTTTYRTTTYRTTTQPPETTYFEVTTLPQTTTMKPPRRTVSHYVFSSSARPSSRSSTTPSYRTSTNSRSRGTRPTTTTTPAYTTFPPSTDRLAAQSSSNVQSSVYVEPSTTPIFSSTTTPTIQTTTNKYLERILNAQSTHNPSDTSSTSEMIQILKANGLYAMAKYLKQSGLDNVLNETGPYTVFAPTDKAFKNLLVQLGGPERAEEKFKANPRLLSGLLLHHIIPGSFEVSSLQDEMTGVSLAGTQLRVNQYSMHDQEWNDVMVTTINGAMIVSDKQDIKIPQGIAHGVDRVMFPLPVGDLLQTLQSDRERRFTTFLKIVYASGMSEILQNKGHKTYTIFAPTDKAFGDFDQTALEKLTTDKDAAQAFTMKYIMPGTLFSAGMRFYQVKDSLLPGNSITLQKTSNGKIKVNEAQMITSNIPATNGVIHAIDGPI